MLLCFHKHRTHTTNKWRTADKYHHFIPIWSVSLDKAEVGKKYSQLFCGDLCLFYLKKQSCHRQLIVISSQGREVWKYNYILTPWCNWRHSATESPKSARVTHELCLSVRSQKVFLRVLDNQKYPTGRQPAWSLTRAIELGVDSLRASLESTQRPPSPPRREYGNCKKQTKKPSVVLMRLVQITCKPPPR